MYRSLTLGAVALGLFGGLGSVAAQGVYVNGVYTEAGQSITVPADGLTINGATPTFGTEYAAPAATQGGQYVVAPQTGLVETVPVGSYGTVQTGAAQTYTVPATGGSQTFPLPAEGDATYNIVVPSAQAPAVTYAEPVAYAEPAASGWGARQVYVAVRGGVSRTRDSDLTVDRVFPDGRGLKVESEYDDPGFIGTAAVGYRAAPGNGWIGYRVEIEGGYQTAEVERHRLRGVESIGGNRVNGDANVLFGFVNAYGDVPITDRLTFTAGGGVGVGRVELDGYSARLADGTRARVVDDSDTTFGYHLDAGVAYQLTDSVALEATYRYQSFMDAELRTENGNREDVDIDSHNILVGARVGF